MTVCTRCEEDTEDITRGNSWCRPCRRKSQKKVKYCSTCEVKLIGHGNVTHCKPCKAEYDRERKVRLRKEYHNILRATGCSGCGECHPYVLEVHHLCKGGKRYKSSRAQGSMYNLQDLERGIAIVLCSNCHSLFHQYFGGKQASFPDQTKESAVEIIHAARRIVL